MGGSWKSSSVLDGGVGTKYLVLSTWYQGLGTKHLVPSPWYQVLVPSTWYQVLGPKYLVPKYLVPTTAIDRVWINKGCRLKRKPTAPSADSTALDKIWPRRLFYPLSVVRREGGTITDPNQGLYATWDALVWCKTLTSCVGKICPSF